MRRLRFISMGLKIGGHRSRWAGAVIPSAVALVLGLLATGLSALALAPPASALPPCPLPQYHPPVAAATVSPNPVAYLKPVSFNGSQSTPGETDGENYINGECVPYSELDAITSYSWTFGDNQSSSGVTLSHTYSAPGTYRAILTVTTASGHSDTAETLVTATGPQAVIVGGSSCDATKSFDATHSGGPYVITGYAWTFGDGSTGTGASPTHTFTTAGTYTVGLTVTDTNGVSARTSTQVKVALAGFTASSGPEWTKTFSVTTTSSNVCGPITGVTWTFGDGAGKSGATVTHTYVSAGVFMVSVTASGQGFSASTTRTVNVVPDTTVPVITISTPPADAVYLEGQPVFAEYSCSDPGGSGFMPAPGGGFTADACQGSVPGGGLLDTAVAGDKPFTVSSETIGGTRTVVTVTYHVLATAPVVTITSPRAGAVYGRGVAVAANYTCVEVWRTATCLGSGTSGQQVLNGQSIDTATLGQHTFLVVARDPAGHETRATVTYSVVDVTPPTIDIMVPGDGAVFGRGQTVRASFGCHDDSGGVGLVSCIGQRRKSQPIDTRRAGYTTFTVVAKDAAGNTTTRTVRYYVFNYPRLASIVRMEYTFMRSGAMRINRLLVAADVPAGARVEVTCRGRGCPSRVHPVNVRRRASRLLLGQWTGRVLWPGATLRIAVSKPLTVGVTTIYRVGRNTADRTDLCVPPKGKSRVC